MTYFKDGLTGVIQGNDPKIRGKIYDEFFNYNHIPRVIVIDIHKFKLINDTFGHDKGDECLKCFGTVLNSNFSNDTSYNSVVLRTGGDEFMIITGCDEEVIKAKLANMEKEILNYFILDMIPCNFKFNAGITLAKHSLDATYEEADTFMYDAKKQNISFAIYNDEKYRELKADELFVNDVKKEIEENKTLLAGRNLYDAVGKTDIIDVFTRNSKGKTIFDSNKHELLRKYHKLTYLDFANLKKIIINKSLVKGHRLMINIDAETLLNKNEDFTRFIMALCDIAESSPENYILCVNVGAIGNEWEAIISTLNMLSNYGFEIGISCSDMSKVNPSLNIWSNAKVDYVKIGKDLWFDNSEGKIHGLIKSTIHIFNEYGTTPIFTRVESLEENKKINTITTKGFAEGKAFDKEKKLILH